MDTCAPTTRPRCTRQASTSKSLLSLLVEDPLAGSDELIQYGDSSTDPAFHDRPRRHETELSLIVGRLSVTEACGRVFRRPCPGHHLTCVVRYTTAARLREHGFKVTRSPTRHNPEQCSVSWDADSDWSNAVRSSFNSCFDGV